MERQRLVVAEDPSVNREPCRWPAIAPCSRRSKSSDAHLGVHDDPVPASRRLHGDQSRLSIRRSVWPDGDYPHRIGLHVHALAENVPLDVIGDANWEAIRQSGCVQGAPYVSETDRADWLRDRSQLAVSPVQFVPFQ